VKVATIGSAKEGPKNWQRKGSGERAVTNERGQRGDAEAEKKGTRNKFEERESLRQDEKGHGLTYSLEKTTEKKKG